MQGCSSDVLRSVNGTASKCPFLATATEECCPARGTLAGHFTRRLSPSPMPGKRIQQQRAYLPLKRSSPRPQFYRFPISSRLWIARFWRRRIVLPIFVFVGRREGWVLRNDYCAQVARFRRNTHSSAEILQRFRRTPLVPHV